MNDVETMLREVMRERGEEVGTLRPLFASSARSEPQRGRRRRAPLVVVAVAVLLIGGAASAAVLRSHFVTPTGDRLLIASGDTSSGHWQLTLYRADVTLPHAPSEPGWCLDYDAPSVNDPGSSTTDRANICTFDTDLPLSDPFGPVGLFPGVQDGQRFLYGIVATDVAAVEVAEGDGPSQQATLIPAPPNTTTGVAYFLAFVSGDGDVRVTARDQTGNAMATRDLGTPSR